MMNRQAQPIRICYFGIYDSEFCRNKVYRNGLIENGTIVLECSDRSGGLMKYLTLFLKHWRIRNNYDVMIVGYPGYIIVPFARLITRKPIIFDALCSFYETQVISRDAYVGVPFRIQYIRFIDWLANISADRILVETEPQRKYYIENMHVPQSKCISVLTGVDNTKFFYDVAIPKNKMFTVLFRGRLTREAGVRHIINAVKLLENEPIKFVVVGFSFGKVVQDLYEQIQKYQLKNLEFIEKQLPMDELFRIMNSAHVSLGQFEDNVRLTRTIPHKAFESLAMRIPYITADVLGIRELLQDGENCLTVPAANPEALAQKILMLKNDVMLQKKLTENGFATYRSKFTTKILGKEVLDVVRDILSTTLEQKIKSSNTGFLRRGGECSDTEGGNSQVDTDGYYSSNNGSKNTPHKNEYS